MTENRFYRYANRMRSEHDNFFWHTAYVGLGSNIGNTRSNLSTALLALRKLSGARFAASPVYMTEPQDDPDQDWFANQVVRLVCEPKITPAVLLRDLQAIEQRMGRRREPWRRYGPRIIDLDLLLFDEVEYVDEELMIPHPRLGERAFVLVPLCDLDADLRLPDGHTPRELLRTVPHVVRGQLIFQSPAPEIF